MPTTTASRTITDRMIGALRLDVAAYEEIEADPKGTGQAAFIVVASSLVAAAGNALARGGEVNVGLIVTIAELLGWALYAWLGYFIGAKMFPAPQTKSSWGEVARTLGFASTPRFGLILVAFPGVSGLVRFTVAVWILVATIVALRSALDCGTVRAVVVAVLASLAQLAVIAFVVNSL